MCYQSDPTMVPARDSNPGVRGRLDRGARGRGHPRADPGRRAGAGRPPPTFLIAGGIFLLAFAWRCAYLMRLAQTPLAGGLTLDARIYWDWAAFIVSHGLWGRNAFFLGPLYPYAL